MAKFTPSPGKPVKMLNEKGEVIDTVFINRAERRRLKVTRTPIKDIPKDEVRAQRRPIKEKENS